MLSHILSNAQCPMLNAQCPMPNAQCPMPNPQFPMPNAPCPIPNSQHFTSKDGKHHSDVTVHPNY
ncbi:MAG: hypothetical protein V7K98_23550 [Nostoc sp.]